MLILSVLSQGGHYISDCSKNNHLLLIRNIINRVMLVVINKSASMQITQIYLHVINEV